MNDQTIQRPVLGDLNAAAFTIALGSLAILAPERSALADVLFGPAAPTAPTVEVSVSPALPLMVALAPIPQEAAPVMGAEQNARDPTPVAVNDSCEWFGGKPWSEWNTMTGDWGGARTGLIENGVTVAGSAIMEWSNAIQGGSGKDNTGRVLLDLNTTFDLGKIFDLKGGSVFLDFQYADTGNGFSVPEAFQPISNIDLPGSGRITQISQAWYQQYFAEDILRVKVGKIDANAEFGYTPALAGFINLSAAVTPTNPLMPTYPNPAFGVNAFLYPCKECYVGFGLYDGSLAEGVQTGNLGPSSLWDGNGVYMTAEAGLTMDNLGPFSGVRAGLGAWWSTSQLTTFSGDEQDGVGGIYGIAEARVWRPEGVGDASSCRRGLWIAGQFGCTDSGVFAAANQIGFGAALSGTFSGRDLDGAGVYISWVDFASGANLGDGSNETMVECYYDVAVTPWFRLKPDMQFVFDPSGDSTVDTSVIFTLRATVTF
ncbi:MAG: hypothetical protein EXS10_00615 [Phycisphaerales bacterium]|nr:hypothetical protein [Phycisphaerales bacterium]